MESGGMIFRKVLKVKHIQMPQVITVNKNAAYPIAANQLKQSKRMGDFCPMDRALSVD